MQLEVLEGKLCDLILIEEDAFFCYVKNKLENDQAVNQESNQEAISASNGGGRKREDEKKTMYFEIKLQKTWMWQVKYRRNQSCVEQLGGYRSSFNMEK